MCRQYREEAALGAATPKARSRCLARRCIGLRDTDILRRRSRTAPGVEKPPAGSELNDVEGVIAKQMNAGKDNPGHGSGEPSQPRDFEMVVADASEEIEVEEVHATSISS